MSNAAIVPPPGFDALSPQDKLDYVHALWDSIVDGVDAPRPPDWHDEVVRERLIAHRRDPDAARPWEEALRDLELALDSWRLRR